MTTYTSPQDGTTLDSLLYSASPTSNYSSQTSVAAGERNDTVGIYRSLFQFPGLTDGNIPSNAVIDNAKLYLNLLGMLASNNATINLYRSKRAVSIPQCTWNNYTTSNAWSTAGGYSSADCETAEIGSCQLKTTDSIGAWFSWDLTASAIQEIVCGTWTTPTFLLKSTTELNDSYTFCSSNNSVSVRPYIVVNYHVPKKICGISYVDIKKISGITIGNAKKVSGV